MPFSPSFPHSTGILPPAFIVESLTAKISAAKLAEAAEASKGREHSLFKMPSV